jgi:hypothetical protein
MVGSFISTSLSYGRTTIHSVHMLIGRICLSLITVVMTVIHVDRGAGLYFKMMLMPVTRLREVLHDMGMPHRVGIFAGASGISMVVPVRN